MPCHAWSPFGEDGDVVAVDDVAREGDDERAVHAERLRREEHLLDDVAVAVVAEERRVVAVVRDEAHPPVRRLLADAHEADGRQPLEVEPARLQVGVAVVVVARGLVGVRVVRQVAHRARPRRPPGPTSFSLSPSCSVGRDAEPVREEVVLADRVAQGARVPDLFTDAVTSSGKLRSCS